MEPLGLAQLGAVASSTQPTPELHLRFHDTLAVGERLWIRGHISLWAALNGQADKRSWWKPWKKNGELVPQPLRIETTVSGQVLEAELSVNADGHFEGSLTARLPQARRGWRVARNRVTLNGYSAEACNVLLARDLTSAVIVMLPLEATWAADGGQSLGATSGVVEVLPRLQTIQRSAGQAPAVYYLAVVPSDCESHRSDLALALTALGWPAGQLLLFPSQRQEAGQTIAAALDRFRWLFAGTLEPWLLNLEPEFAAPASAVLEPVPDRSNVRDGKSLNGSNGVAMYPARRVLARPTRTALLPRFPVVFCHGMLGYSMLKMHRPEETNYFSVLRGFLDPRGVHVLFPKVAPTGGVAARSEELRDQIRRWTDEPVNIVAHSMGGLDARFMMAHLGMANHVRSLTTIATPHHGSHMADWFQANFRRRVPLLLALEALGLNVDGFRDCRPDACREFNAQTPNSPGVRYFSYGGDVPPARLTPFLRRAWSILTPVEGPNDGLVSVRSSRWGEDLGTIQADHFAQTPDGIFVRDGEDFDALGFYVRLIENLARRGF